MSFGGVTLQPMLSTGDVVYRVHNNAVQRLVFVEKKKLYIFRSGGDILKLGLYDLPQLSFSKIDVVVNLRASLIEALENVTKEYLQIKHEYYGNA